MQKTTTPRRIGLLLALLITSMSLLVGCNSQDSQQLSIGDPAPNFTAETADGSSISLSNYTDKQPVLLFFHMAEG